MTNSDAGALRQKAGRRCVFVKFQPGGGGQRTLVEAKTARTGEELLSQSFFPAASRPRGSPIPVGVRQLPADSFKPSQLELLPSA